MRKFSKRQKQALYKLAKGMCSLCGEPLPDVWHADHVRAWSQGGETRILNGQALCPKCNLRKGAKMELRDWQIRAHEVLGKLDKQDITVEAPMGSGKTYFGKYEAGEWIRSDRADAVVILAHRTAIVGQWKRGDDEEDFGLKMLAVSNEDLRKGKVSDEVNGLTVTYQQITASPKALRDWAIDKRVFVICDELHALAVGKEFWSSLETAIPHAVRRLGLTATPMRSDKLLIPLMEWDEHEEDGRKVFEGRVDFRYPLEAAVGDGTLRYPCAIFHDGEMAWSQDGETITGTFEAEIPEQYVGSRLRTALDPFLPYMVADGETLNDKSFFGRLYAHMQERRAAYPDFGCKCIVFCKDIEAADLYAIQFKRLTGVEPCVVHSEKPGAVEILEVWKTDPSVYCFAVGMIHVGFDCDRVTDVAMATTTSYTGWLYQGFGRALRRPRDKEKNDIGPTVAYMIAPKDARFVGFYEQWKETMSSYVQSPEAQEQDLKETELLERDYRALMAEITQETRLPGETIAMEFARRAQQAVASGASLLDIEAIFQQFAQLQMPKVHGASTAMEPAESYEERVEKIRTIIYRTIQSTVRTAVSKYKVNVKEYENTYRSNPWGDATRILALKAGMPKPNLNLKSASEKQLHEMKRIMDNGFKKQLTSTNPREWNHRWLAQ